MYFPFAAGECRHFQGSFGFGFSNGNGFQATLWVLFALLSVTSVTGRPFCGCNTELEKGATVGVCGSNGKEYVNHCVLECDAHVDRVLHEIDRDASTGLCPPFIPTSYVDAVNNGQRTTSKQQRRKKNKNKKDGKNGSNNNGDDLNENGMTSAATSVTKQANNFTSFKNIAIMIYSVVVFLCN